MAWSADDQFLYFVRGMSPAVSTQLWRVSGEGGTPEYANLTTTGMGSFDISRDGKRLIYGVGGVPKVEVWALDNVEATLKSPR